MEVWNMPYKLIPNQLILHFKLTKRTLETYFILENNKKKYFFSERPQFDPDGVRKVRE